MHSYSFEDIFISGEDTEEEGRIFNNPNVDRADNLNTGFNSKPNFNYLSERLIEEYNYFRKSENKVDDSLKYIANYPSNNNAFKIERIKVLILLEFVMILDILIEGNEKIPSFLGVKKYHALLKLGVHLIFGLHSYHLVYFVFGLRNILIIIY